MHETLAAAKATGFRPCKRCNPDGISIEEENAAIIAQACRLIEESEEVPLLNHLAKAVGRSSQLLSSHVQDHHGSNAAGVWNASACRSSASWPSAKNEGFRHSSLHPLSSLNNITVTKSYDGSFAKQ